MTKHRPVYPSRGADKASRNGLLLVALTILEVTLAAPTAQATAAKYCYKSGEAVTLRGTALSRQVSDPNGTKSTVWILKAVGDACAMQALPWSPGAHPFDVMEVQIIGEPPPTGVPIELQGKLETGKFSPNFAVPMALKVTSGRKLHAGESSFASPPAQLPYDATTTGRASSDVSASPASPDGEGTSSDAPRVSTASHTSDHGRVLIGLIVVASLIGAYFAPAILATGRKKRNAPAILALNLFLGWTFLGWVLALVWSLTADV